MQKKIVITVLPSEAASDAALRRVAAETSSVPEEKISGFHILKRSLDARGREPRFQLTLLLFIDEPFFARTVNKISFRDVSRVTRNVIIAGAGPAGLFAALALIERGIRPIIMERGKDVRARRRDLAVLNKEGTVNEESNYCFGEGGAGTYSDGKLYTRSTKRGDVSRILNLFVQFGADERILYEAHPHIGTNKLPQIITNMRRQIESCGGTFLFDTKVTDLVITGDQVVGVVTASEDILEADSVILATGHSARDVFQLLARRKIAIEFKPFALGVRVEHPQSLIDSIQYHRAYRGEHLPPASYGLVQQVHEKGVFSFCMCPGGIIAPAATNAGELVVNGWSPSKRNNPFANSGMVATIEMNDIVPFHKYGELAGMMFQSHVEHRAFEEGGGRFVAPAQRLEDMVNRKRSATLPDCSYLPGIRSASMQDVLPGFVYESLRNAFRHFGKKMKGYLTNEAVVVAPESRTSSPVRIPRDRDKLHHIQIRNLYPCGEGAGYAGGIISAAMDGERVAMAIAKALGAESAIHPHA